MAGRLLGIVDICSVPDEQFISIVCFLLCLFCKQLDVFPQKAPKVMFWVKDEGREKSQMGHQIKRNI